jgi:uncharacterized oxidoreductase
VPQARTRAHAFRAWLLDRPTRQPLTISQPHTPDASHAVTRSNYRLRASAKLTSHSAAELDAPAGRREAKPLEEFLSAVLSLLHSEPDAKEIIVDQVKFLRYAVATGSYDRVLTLLSSF